MAVIAEDDEEEEQVGELPLLENSQRRDSEPEPEETESNVDDADKRKPHLDVPSSCSDSTKTPSEPELNSPKSDDDVKQTGFSLRWRDCLALGLGITALGAIFWLRRRNAD